MKEIAALIILAVLTISAVVLFIGVLGADDYASKDYDR